MARDVKRVSLVHVLTPAHHSGPERLARPYSGCGGRTIMPGLIDNHVHLNLNGSSLFDGEANQTWEDIAIRSTAMAKLYLMEGFTTVAAQIRLPNVVPPDDEYVGFLLFRHIKYPP